MGCAQSTRPSMTSPPDQWLEKLKMDNGYAKGGYYGARKSTGQRGGGIRQESDRAMKPESRNESRNRVESGRVSVSGEVDVKEGIDRGRKSSSSLRDDKSSGKVHEKAEVMNMGGEDELVDGWPKWFTDNVPKEVLKNIVPKSADSYIKIDKIGQGTYSNVYKARDKETSKIVALKKVRFDTSEPESVKFMAREIVILLQLDHPNIVKLEGLATSRMQYSLYLVFEYMHSDLARILSRPDERLTEPQIKSYMNQLLSGLEHCHERGILHRDIKGSNLLIDRNGMLKIADFGLGNYFNTGKKRPLTSRVVTLWYRAPELLLGSTDYGAGIDLWSAGCLMAEMFAGRPIMPARTEVEQLHRIFRLCGTPADDYYRRLKLSTSLKPPKAYKSTLRETFRDFPSSSVGLLNILLAMEPAHRRTAASALQHEFFQTSPLACDLSGLPKIHIEEDDQDLITDRRKHRTSRRRSRSHREQRKKSLPVEEKGDAEEEPKQSAESITVFGLETGSSTASSSSISTKPVVKEETRLYPSPIVPNQETSPKTESHPNATKNIKNRPPLPAARRRTTNYNLNADGADRLDMVRRSASTREFRSTENKNKLRPRSFDD